ncbi:hypothetical protein, partial [Streptomyces sp. NPDC054888]
AGRDQPAGACCLVASGGRGLFIVDTLATRRGDDHSGAGHTVRAASDVKPHTGAPSAPEWHVTAANPIQDRSDPPGAANRC